MVLSLQNLIFLIGGAGILLVAAITPWALAAVNRDLVNLLMLWFLTALFSIGESRLVLPMFLKISPYQVMLLILVLAFISQVAIGQRRLQPLGRVEIAMLIFAAVALFSEISAGILVAKGEGLKIANLFNGFLFPFVIFFLSKHLVDTDRKLIKVLAVLLGVGTYLSVTAIGELTPRLAFLVHPAYILDPFQGIHFGRARGPFLNAAANGTVLGMIFVTGLYLSLSDGIKPAVRGLVRVLTALLPVGVYLTLTRACWLGMLLSGFVAVLGFPRLRKFFIPGVVLAGVAVLALVAIKSQGEVRLTQMDPIYSRLHIYNASFHMLVDKPFLGHGFDNFRNVSPQYFSSIKGIPYSGETIVPHDTFLGLLVELGLIGFIPLALIYIFLWRDSLQLFRRLPPEGMLGKYFIVAFWGVGTVFLVNMQFIDMRYFVFPNAIFFLLAGVMAGIHHKVFAGDRDHRRASILVP